jgi:hypothetical protein
LRQGYLHRTRRPSTIEACTDRNQLILLAGGRGQEGPTTHGKILFPAEAEDRLGVSGMGSEPLGGRSPSGGADGRGGSSDGRPEEGRHDVGWEWEEDGSQGGSPPPFGQGDSTTTPQSTRKPSPSTRTSAKQPVEDIYKNHQPEEAPASATTERGRRKEEQTSE